MPISSSRRRHAFLIGALAVLAACGGGEPALAGGTKAAKKKSAVFTVSAVQTGQGGQVTVTSKVWITPTQARADVKHPLQGDATFLVTNGFLYQLVPQTKKGVRGPLPDEMKSSPDNFTLLFSRFAFDASDALKRAKKVRSEQMGGFKCDVLEDKRNSGERSGTLTLWVPQGIDPVIPVKAKIVDKIVRPGASLQQNLEVTLSGLKLGTEIAASVFAVPQGYQIETSSPEPAPGAASPGAKSTGGPPASGRKGTPRPAGKAAPAGKAVPAGKNAPPGK
jgi:outer membrane lipoprotein-sorting protein